MTGALLSAVLAVLVWPDRRAGSTRRVVLSGAAGSPGLPPLPPSSQWASSWLAAAGTVGLAAVLSTALVALLAGLLALTGARAWAAVRRDRTEDARLAELSEGLGALAAELRGGRPLAVATSTAVTACGGAVSGRALARAVRVPETGIRRWADSAGEDAAAGGDRAVGSALDRISAAVELSTRTGCSLADVIGAVDEDLRARRRHRQELRAAVAAPRASAMLLAGLPALGFAMGSGIGADPWQVLTTTGAGQVLLVLGVAFELAGLAWSRRLVSSVLR